MQHSAPSFKDEKVPPPLTQRPHKHSKGKGRVQRFQKGRCKILMLKCIHVTCDHVPPTSGTISPTDSSVDSDMKGRAVKKGSGG